MEDLNLLEEEIQNLNELIRLRERKGELLQRRNVASNKPAAIAAFAAIGQGSPTTVTDILEEEVASPRKRCRVNSPLHEKEIVLMTPHMEGGVGAEAEAGVGAEAGAGVGAEAGTGAETGAGEEAEAGVGVGTGSGSNCGGTDSSTAAVAAVVGAADVLPKLPEQFGWKVLLKKPYSWYHFKGGPNAFYYLRPVVKQSDGKRYTSAKELLGNTNFIKGVHYFDDEPDALIAASGLYGVEEPSDIDSASDASDDDDTTSDDDAVDDIESVAILGANDHDDSASDSDSDIDTDTDDEEEDEEDEYIPGYAGGRKDHIKDGKPLVGVIHCYKKKRRQS
jgi:hypothetical protein